MKKQTGFVILALLIVIITVTANKRCRVSGYKRCSRTECRDTVMDRKCCHFGEKLAKRKYACSVDSVISTLDYLRSLKRKIHSKRTLPVNKLFHKVKQCKRVEDCLRCCCMQRKQRMFFGG